MSDRENAEAAALNLFGRGSFEIARRRLHSIAAEINQLEDELAEKIERIVEAHDKADRAIRAMLDSAEVVLRTEDRARQHDLVEEAKSKIAAFVSERQALRRAA
jgi:hypothetical protein